MAQNNELPENELPVQVLESLGQFWDKEQTQPMSYEAAYGSNGARDFMRNVANQARGVKHIKAAKHTCRKNKNK